MEKISEHVYWLPPAPPDRPSLCAVEGERATIWLDAGSSAAHTREFLDALAARGVARPAHVVLTHSHWDHVSGLDSLDVPIWMNSGERRYAADDPGGAVFRRVAGGHEIHDYEFDGPPYLGFPSSFDVHGDGSVAVVLAGGHTTGSVVIFVTTPPGQRYAFVGDVTWQLDGVRQRVERPWLLRKLADSDPEQVRQDLLRVIALADLMQIVPAHDLDAYHGIPDLVSRPAPVATPKPAEQSPEDPGVAETSFND